MNVAVLLDKEYLKGIIEKVTQMAFGKLKSMFPEFQTEPENIVSALLVGQLALQATVRMLPRPRAVLDDAILTDVLALIRKMVGEKIEFERQNDGAAIRHPYRSSGSALPLLQLLTERLGRVHPG